jgi:hypothetical protein
MVASEKRIFSTELIIVLSPVQFSKLLQVLASTSILGSESRGDHDHILLNHDSGSDGTTRLLSFSPESESESLYDWRFTAI